VNKLIIGAVCVILLGVGGLGAAYYIIKPPPSIGPLDKGASYDDFAYHCLLAPADEEQVIGEGSNEILFVTIYRKSNPPDECIGRWMFQDGKLVR